MLTRAIAPDVRAAHAPAQPGELRYSIANIEAARRALAYAPTRTLEHDLPGVIEEIRTR
jgi:hypothetical protein